MLLRSLPRIRTARAAVAAVAAVRISAVIASLWLSGCMRAPEDGDWERELATPDVAEPALVRAVLGALQEADPDLRYARTGPLQLERAGTEGPGASTLYLDNLYRSLPEDPRERVEAVRRLVRAAILGRTEVGPSSRGSVLPVVRDQLFLADAVNQFGATHSGNLPVSERLVGNLYVLYVLDLPDSIQYLSALDLEEIGIERSDLRQLAVENLKALVEGQLSSEGGELGVYMIYAEGTYESSLLLVDELWANVSEQLGAPPAIGVPARDVLLFASSTDVAATQQLRTITKKLTSEVSYAVSDRIYVRTERGWAEIE